MQSTSVGEKASSTSVPEGRHGTAALIHASAVRFCNKGVLLLGPSGAGKSDMALCLIEAGAMLIADDQLHLRRQGDRLHAAPPDRLAGLIALRGLGIMRLPFAPGPLDLAVDLVPSGALADPLPEPAAASWHGVDLPRICLDPHRPSAVARIRVVLQAERVC
ncbi:MAG: HPr kinase/phosphatase C-terminal domain-containing protein [Alphaproteobacteria bacterium]